MPKPARTRTKACEQCTVHSAQCQVVSTTLFRVVSAPPTTEGCFARLSGLKRRLSRCIGPVARETLTNGTKHPLPLWLFEVRERATGNSDPRVRDFAYRPGQLRPGG